MIKAVILLHSHARNESDVLARALKVDGLFEIVLQCARILATPVPIDLVVAACQEKLESA